MYTHGIDNHNLILIGMPGVGKSTLGVVLAKVLNLDFVDADLLIQKRHGATLHELINSRGVEGFLSLESAELCGIEVTGAVIATGGSAVYSDEAMQHLHSIGTVVYLSASLAEIRQRLGSLDERGVVMRGADTRDLADVYRERVPLYERYADVTVDVDGLSIRQALEAVIAALC